MDHLPLKLGTHTTAMGNVTIIRLGKGGVWAFDAAGTQWSVATGVHGKYFKNPIWDITGRVVATDTSCDITRRVEPAPTVLDDPSPKRIWAWGNGKTLVYCAAVEPSNRSTVKYVRADTVAPVQLEHSRQEVGNLHSQVARVTAERDEAVALLRVVTDISTAHDALLALEMLKERQTGDSSGGSWSHGWDAGLDAAIKVVANLTEAKP